MEGLIEWTVIILFLILSPFTLLIDTSLEFRDSVKVPYLLSYHIMRTLNSLENNFTWVWRYFMNKSLLHLHMSIIFGVSNVLMYRNTTRDFLMEFVPTVSSLIPRCSSPISFTEILSDFISSADVTSLLSPCTYTIFT